MFTFRSFFYTHIIYRKCGKYVLGFKIGVHLTLIMGLWAAMIVAAIAHFHLGNSLIKGIDRKGNYSYRKGITRLEVVNVSTVRGWSSKGVNYVDCDKEIHRPIEIGYNHCQLPLGIQINRFALLQPNTVYYSTIEFKKFYFWH